METVPLFLTNKSAVYCIKDTQKVSIQLTKRKQKTLAKYTSVYLTKGGTEIQNNPDYFYKDKGDETIVIYIHILIRLH